jgi:hypothetical protein
MFEAKASIIAIFIAKTSILDFEFSDVFLELDLLTNKTT